MVKEYQTKAKKIYRHLKCPRDIDIPISDSDGWNYHKEHRWIYYKTNIAELQGLKFKPMPIEPDKYPVILKPIINLYGMGLNSYKLENEEDFYEHFFHNGFWEEYLEGEHYSFDFLIQKGEVKWHCCFQGFPGEAHGSFTHWESLEKDIPKNIYKLIEKLGQYTGLLNVECIGEYMIEAHLRMGDMDQFIETEILETVIRLYQGCSGSGFQNQNQDIQLNIKPKKIFLIPIWSTEKYWEDDLDIVEENEEEIKQILEKHDVIFYQIDKDIGANPPGERRLMNLTVHDLNKGQAAMQDIKDFISTFYVSASDSSDSSDS